MSAVLSSKTPESFDKSRDSTSAKWSSPPLLDDLLEDLEDVDHCLVSSPRVSSESPSFPPAPPSASAADPAASAPCPWSTELVSVPPSLYWAIFLAKASWVSSSSCLMSSMVRPYHSSCQHHACRLMKQQLLRLHVFLTLWSNQQIFNH
ncbi:hypothetical protein EYF80_021635 [Liparis tanakae]|uniref:Uncharacterized protein n=1 Tax=Liparis tanakae TaxID=230148 RepID=A0A4Z2HTG2_9TELE|nr:hypothetical protein EYF80_021635 [Liparis tanakae]